jgi:hypothetical protein
MKLILLCVWTERAVLGSAKIALTPYTTLIQTSFMYSKWNMGEICGLKFHFLQVHASQKILFKSLHAQKMSFLLLNLQFWQKIHLSMTKKYFPKKALRMQGVKKKILDHFSPSFLGQKY